MKKHDLPSLQWFLCKKLVSSNLKPTWHNNFGNGISSRTCKGYNATDWFVEPYLLVCMKNCWSNLPGMVRVTIVALMRVTSAPLSGRLEIAINRCPLSSRVICFTPGCSSLNRTCSVRRFQMRMLPDSADTMYLTMQQSASARNQGQNIKIPACSLTFV